MMALRTTGLVLVLTAGLAMPAAQAETAPPHLTDGFGLVVVSQPKWVDDGERTFTFTVTTDEVPAYGVLPGQVSGEHVVMVTLPDEYDGTTRYPVQYHLHGAADYPEAQRNKEIIEQATAGVPMVTVVPNGSGRGWYSDWVNPGVFGRQNWATFHLDQLVPFIDANLSTMATREGRVISGHSMGGFGAFHYAEHRPDLFSYVGSFSGGLDLTSVSQRVAVVLTEAAAGVGLPIVLPDAIFGPPVPPADGVWAEESSAARRVVAGHGNRHVRGQRGRHLRRRGAGADREPGPLHRAGHREEPDQGGHPVPLHRLRRRVVVGARLHGPAQRAAVPPGRHEPLRRAGHGTVKDAFPAEEDVRHRTST